MFGAYQSAKDINPVDFIVFSRLISAIVGTVTVYMTYLVGKKLISHNTGIVAAALLSTIFLHVMTSHYATQDALFTLLVVIVFYWAIEAYHHDHLSSYIAFGISAGLATATSLTGSLSMGLALIVAYHYGMKQAFKKLFLVGTFAFATFLLVSPYFIFDFASYFADVQYTLDFHATGKNAESASDLNGVSTWLWWAKYFVASGLLWPLSLAALCGAVYLIKKCSIKSILLLSYPVLWAIVLLKHSVRYDRHATSLMPFFALIAAIAILKVLEYVDFRCQKRWLNNSLLIAFGVIFVCYPLFVTSAYGYLLTKKDTSIRATEWIESNIEKNVKIAVLTSRGAEKFSMPFNRLIGPYKVLFSHLHWNNFISNTDIYSSEGIQYIVVGSDYANGSKVYRAVWGDKKYEFFKNLKENYELVATFDEPWFNNEFFSPHALELSSLVNFIHHRTYEIYFLGKSGKQKDGNDGKYYTQKFKKFFSPEKLSKFSNTKLIKNPGSKFGETLLGGGESAKEELVVWGPYDNIPVGNYEVTFSLNINKCEDKKPVAEISVNPAGITKPYSKKTIQCSDFEKRNPFNKFILNFHNPVQNSWNPRIETVVKSRNNGTIEIEYIEVSGNGVEF